MTITNNVAKVQPSLITHPFELESDLEPDLHHDNNQQCGKGSAQFDNPPIRIRVYVVLLLDADSKMCTNATLLIFCQGVAPIVDHR